MSDREQETIEVDAATAATTFIAHAGTTFPEGTAEVTQVIAEQTGGADAQWNVSLGGSDLFSAEQSVSSADTSETFTPDQNRYSSTETDKLEVDVSTAAATASDQLLVTVVYEV